MDSSGKIHSMSEEEAEELHKSIKYAKDLFDKVPLSKEQHDEIKPMKPSRRVGHMRNQPCPCGSGLKLKKCCIDRFKENV